MRITKELVKSIMIKHATDGTRNPIPGDLVDFSFPKNFTLEEMKRTEKNAIRWGWIDEYSRLTNVGWRAL